METTDALLALAALGQETRLDVFRLLVKSGSDGLAAGEIAERTGVLPNTLSAHLSALSRAGLVKAEREGRVIRYAADLDGVRALLSFLIEDCCNGRPELCAPVLDQIACRC